MQKIVCEWPELTQNKSHPMRSGPIIQDPGSVTHWQNWHSSVLWAQFALTPIFAVSEECFPGEQRTHCQWWCLSSHVAWLLHVSPSEWCLEDVLLWMAQHGLTVMKEVNADMPIFHAETSFISAERGLRWRILSWTSLQHQFSFGSFLSFWFSFANTQKVCSFERIEPKAQFNSWFDMSKGETAWAESLVKKKFVSVFRTWDAAQRNWRKVWHWSGSLCLLCVGFLRWFWHECERPIKRVHCDKANFSLFEAGKVQMCVCVINILLSIHCRSFKVGKKKKHDIQTCKNDCCWQWQSWSNISSFKKTQADAKELQKVHLVNPPKIVVRQHLPITSHPLVFFACLHALNCSFLHCQTRLQSLLKSKLEDCKRTIQRRLWVN